MLLLLLQLLLLSLLLLLLLLLLLMLLLRRSSLLIFHAGQAGRNCLVTRQQLLQQGHHGWISCRDRGVRVDARGSVLAVASCRYNIAKWRYGSSSLRPTSHVQQGVLASPLIDVLRSPSRVVVHHDESRSTIWIP